MARVKATTTDIHARLARGECANYRAGNCLGKRPCLVINGEACDYFSSYVMPLLEYSEFSDKYAREAKISVALNPHSKVVHKRRQAAQVSTLALETSKPLKVTPASRITPPIENTANVRKSAATAPTRRERTVTPSLVLASGALLEEETSATMSAITAPQVFETPREVNHPYLPPTLPEQAVTTVVSVSGEVFSKPRVDLAPAESALLLELCPAEAPRRKTARKR
jgi:hypothetical protein